ncbi:hypothetical protein [Pseudomonas oryzihabitans]|uniref:hypothetical protein n=1 Tax=Pseudomonas oryzihabitans TaxID=47885 RepID=UPI0011156FAF|nr:hypothetical protein [Pseudomonas psychrotolerans]
MNKQTTSVSHNDAAYDLIIGGWLKNLRSAHSKAILEIATDDILLPNGQKAGIYKAEKRSEYDAQPNKPCASAKKHLDSCSRRDFRLEWDKLISVAKQKINDTCVPLILAQRVLSKAEQYEILKAASNGHVRAMYWIGTSLRDRKDDNCLLWLSMAHNWGHVGACYEMAAHLKSKGNHIETLRCLIVSADGGSDIAYMSIFSIDILIDMFKIQEISQLESMLDELSATHSSCARYFKGMLMLFQGKKADGISILEAYSNNPKKQISEDNADVVHANQIKAVSRFIDSVLADIASGIEPLNAISARDKEAGFIKFEDYDEIATVFNNMRQSG